MYTRPSKSFRNSVSSRNSIVPVVRGKARKSYHRKASDGGAAEMHEHFNQYAGAASLVVFKGAGFDFVAIPSLTSTD